MIKKSLLIGTVAAATLGLAACNANHDSSSMNSTSSNQQAQTTSGKAHFAKQENMMIRQLSQSGMKVQHESNHRITFSPPSDSSFTISSASLNDNFKSELRTMAKVIKSPQVSSATIRGNTDSTGTPQINSPLSKQRAQAVANFVMAQGVPSSKLVVMGNGERNPRASNATAQGRQDNRRVDVTIQENTSAMQKMAGTSQSS